MVHSEIVAVPAQRLERERELLRPLPSLRPEIGVKVVSRKVDKLSCIRFGSARYSVPCRLIGHQVTITTREGRLSVIAPVTGEVLAEHRLVAPGETSIADAHYDRARPDRPSRAPRPRTQVETDFCALGPAAEAFLVGAIAAGVSKLGAELAEIMALAAAHGAPALVTALERAVTYRRWRAGDIRSILATAGAAPTPRPAGESLAEVSADRRGSPDARRHRGARGAAEQIEPVLRIEDARDVVRCGRDVGVKVELDLGILISAGGVLTQ